MQQITTPATDTDAFSYASYRRLLTRLLERGYRFGTFVEALGNPWAGSSPRVLMRHDIDFDLPAARRMAEVEREVGVEATYFFMLRTAHYSVFTKEGTAEVQKILDMGHHLALHFDCAAYPEDASEEDLASACRKEAGMLGDWFNRSVEVVSYHRPSPVVLTGNPALSAPLPHTYMSQFVNDMKYCSDSRGQWKYGDPTSQTAFQEGQPMHILIHPIWWTDSAIPAEAVLAHWLREQIDFIENSMEANCTVYQKKRGQGNA
jgi:hypothetical protein